MKGKQPTIDDVAALSGVGRTTVSRVINGGPNVRPQVRDRVQNAIESLGYVVNVQAQMLASGSARRLTMVHASVLDVEPNSYYQAGLEIGALRACSQYGLTLNSVMINPDRAETLHRMIEAIGARRDEGVILTPPFSDDVELVRRLIAAEWPVVCISAGSETSSLAACVGIDDCAAGHAIGAHLIALGHVNFAYIDGLESHLSAGRRLAGFRSALVQPGMVESQLLVERGNFTFRSGIEIGEHILRAFPATTALVCANDDMAAGALFSAHRLGLAIPGDVSVTGFDDTPVSEIVWPPLTTAHQPLRLIGQRAVEILVETSRANLRTTLPIFESMPFRLVERSSTGRPRTVIERGTFARPLQRTGAPAEREEDVASAVDSMTAPQSNPA